MAQLTPPSPTHIHPVIHFDYVGSLSSISSFKIIHRFDSNLLQCYISSQHYYHGDLACKEHPRGQWPEGQDLGLRSGQRRLPGGLHEAITGQSKAGQVGESGDQLGGKMYH